MTNDEMDYLEEYDKYADEQSGLFHVHDDMMSDLMEDIRKFKQTISGKETEEELMKKIYEKTDELSEKYHEIRSEYIFNAVMEEMKSK